MNQIEPSGEISSSEAGINTLEDLMKLGPVMHSRSDPTLFLVNGQEIRIDSKLYQDYCDFSQAFHYSEAYQSGAGMTDEWRQNYLENYNAGTLPPHPQGSSTVGGQTSYTWTLPSGGQTTTPDLTPPKELQETHWQSGGYSPLITPPSTSIPTTTPSLSESIAMPNMSSHLSSLLGNIPEFNAWWKSSTGNDWKGPTSNDSYYKAWNKGSVM